MVVRRVGRTCECTSSSRERGTSQKQKYDFVPLSNTISSGFRLMPTTFILRSTRRDRLTVSEHWSSKTSDKIISTMACSRIGRITAVVMARVVVVSSSYPNSMFVSTSVRVPKTPPLDLQGDDSSLGGPVEGDAAGEGVPLPPLVPPVLPTSPSRISRSRRCQVFVVWERANDVKR
jgi:hypothetical protein